MGAGLQLPNMVGALPMPSSSTLVRDPIMGTFASNTDPTGTDAATDSLKLFIRAFVIAQIV